MGKNIYFSNLVMGTKEILKIEYELIVLRYYICSKTFVNKINNNFKVLMTDNS